MTRTTQSLSQPVIEKPEETGKTEAEDNIDLLLSVCDSLNTLSEKLSRLAYVLQRRNIETSLTNKQ